MFHNHESMRFCQRNLLTHFFALEVTKKLLMVFQMLQAHLLQGIGPGSRVVELILFSLAWPAFLRGLQCDVGTLHRLDLWGCNSFGPS